MPTCPNGHRNPRNQQLCRECDALIIPAKKRRLSDRALWIIVSTGVVAAVVLATVLGVAATHRTEPVTSSAPTTAGSVAMQQWWSAAREHFDELQGALDASRGALERRDLDQ